MPHSTPGDTDRPNLTASADPRIVQVRSRILVEPEEANEAGLEPDWTPPAPFFDPPIKAAVLIGLVYREGAFSVLYTERSSDLRSHSGQVAFPGGKIDDEDDGPGAAALREAMEEVALNPEEAEILGYLPHYFTGSNYLITPVVALVEPSRPFKANPAEVTGMFEVPMTLLSDAGHFGRYPVMREGREVHSTWQVEHDGYKIWGITANLTRRFYDIALKGGAAW